MDVLCEVLNLAVFILCRDAYYTHQTKEKGFCSLPDAVRGLRLSHLIPAGRPSLSNCCILGPAVGTLDVVSYLPLMTTPLRTLGSDK